MAVQAARARAKKEGRDEADGFESTEDKKTKHLNRKLLSSFALYFPSRLEIALIESRTM